MAVSRYRYYDQRTGGTSAWEVEMTLRHFFFEIGKLSCGFEMTGGGLGNAPEGLAVQGIREAEPDAQGPR